MAYGFCPRLRRSHGRRQQGGGYDMLAQNLYPSFTPMVRGG
jgi:hypothetical protein